MMRMKKVMCCNVVLVRLFYMVLGLIGVVDGYVGLVVLCMCIMDICGSF